MWCKWPPSTTPGLGRLCATASAFALSGFLGTGALAQSPTAGTETLSDLEAEALAAEADIETEESRNVTSEGLYQAFKRRFQARGDVRKFRIAVAAARGLTPPGRIACESEFDLPGGGAQVSCRRLHGPAEVFLIDNQEVPGDSVLPEAHDRITPLGRLEASANGTARLTADLGADFFSDSEVDLVVLVRPGDDPTILGRLIALGGPSAFMRKAWRETRGTADGKSGRLPKPSPDPDGFGDDPRVRLGLTDEDVLHGAELFFREDFDGNGRTCASCHRAEANLGLDPAFVRQLRRHELRRFGGLKDPLFVANPRFIGRHPVPELEVPFLLNREAMIRENVDGFDSPAVKFVMRGVPHALSQTPSIAAPGPRADGTLPDGSGPEVAERTGWSGDGAPVSGALRLFPVGAAIQHFRRQFENQTPGPGNFRLPNDAELDRLERFMLTTGRTQDIDLDSIVFADAEAEGGRGAFAAGACGLCHANAGAIARADIVDADLEGQAGDDLGNRNFDTQVERLDSAARQLYLARTGTNLTCDGGFGGQGLGLEGFNFDSDCGLGQDSAAGGDGIDNRDAFGDGRFNSVSVIESADTGPFFHNNAVDTIEEAVGFYRSTAFNTSPAATRFQVNLSGLSDTAIVNIAATLRTLNAGFNLSIVQQRCVAAAKIIHDSLHGGHGGHGGHGENRKTRKLVNGLIVLANEELADARAVLGRRDAEIDEVAQNLAPLYPEVRRIIRRITAANEALLWVKSSKVRRVLAASCGARAKAAREGLTADDSPSVLNFTMGAGNLGF